MPPSRSRSRATRDPDERASEADRTHADGDRAHAEAVFARLQQAVTALVLAAEASLGDRCPYRDAADACTFAGGCQNQRRDIGPPGAGSPGARPQGTPLLRCGGDGKLKWTP